MKVTEARELAAQLITLANAAEAEGRDEIEPGSIVDILLAKGEAIQAENQALIDDLSQ